MEQLVLQTDTIMQWPDSRITINIQLRIVMTLAIHGSTEILLEG